MQIQCHSKYVMTEIVGLFFFSSRRRHTRFDCDWSSDVCSSDLQFGYPGEHWHELKQTISLVRDTRPDEIGVSFSYPLPGTAFYDQVQEQLGFKIGRASCRERV